jgi:hypothetical protein
MISLENPDFVEVGEVSIMMMLCDISVVFNSFAHAFGLMSRKRSSESRQVFVSLQSRESFGRLQYAGVFHSCANIWSTRSASTLMDCQPERLRPQDQRRTRRTLMPEPSPRCFAKVTSGGPSVARRSLICAEHD